MKSSISIPYLGLVSLMAWCCSTPAAAQRQLNEQAPLSSTQQVRLRIEDAQLIRIATWNGNEVVVTGTVSINANENNEAYQLQFTRQDQELVLEAFIKNEDSLPQRITVHQDGQDYWLNARHRQDSVVQQFVQEKGGYDWMSQGVLKDIALQIKIPAQTPLHIESKFGTVEITQITGPLVVESKFGDIDVRVDPASAVSLLTGTQFGTVYTNLDWEFEQEGALTKIKGEQIAGTLNGGGTLLRLEAKFGNVYLRSATP